MWRQPGPDEAFLRQAEGLHHATDLTEEKDQLHRRLDPAAFPQAVDQDHPSELGGQQVEIVARQSFVWRIFQRAEAKSDEAEGNWIQKPQGEGRRNAQAERVRKAKARDT